MTMVTVILDPKSQNQSVSMVTDKSPSYEEATGNYINISVVVS